MIDKMNAKFLFPALLLTVSIVYVSSLPSKTLWGTGSSWDQIVSNLAHIPTYTLLTLLWLFSVAKKARMEVRMPLYIILAGLIVLAVCSEIQQSFVPGRTASLIDVSFNFSGIIFGIIIYRHVVRNRA